jgi:hypothetical protein
MLLLWLLLLLLLLLFLCVQYDLLYGIHLGILAMVEGGDIDDGVFLFQLPYYNWEEGLVPKTRIFVIRATTPMEKGVWSDRTSYAYVLRRSTGAPVLYCTALFINCPGSRTCPSRMHCRKVYSTVLGLVLYSTVLYCKFCVFALLCCVHVKFNRDDDFERRNERRRCRSKENNTIKIYSRDVC